MYFPTSPQHQVGRHASHNWTWHRRNDPAGEGNVILPEVHGNVLFAQGLLGRSARAEQGGAVVGHGAERKKRAFSGGLSRCWRTGFDNRPDLQLSISGTIQKLTFVPPLAANRTPNRILKSYE
jgi:hypothetical protein